MAPGTGEVQCFLYFTLELLRLYIECKSCNKDGDNYSGALGFIYIFLLFEYLYLCMLYRTCTLCLHFMLYNDAIMNI